MTAWPRYSDRRTLLPTTAGRAKSGAFCPTSPAAAAAASVEAASISTIRPDSASSRQAIGGIRSIIAANLTSFAVERRLSNRKYMLPLAFHSQFRERERRVITAPVADPRPRYGGSAPRSRDDAVDHRRELAERDQLVVTRGRAEPGADTAGVGQPLECARLPVQRHVIEDHGFGQQVDRI